MKTKINPNTQAICAIFFLVLNFSVFKAQEGLTPLHANINYLYSDLGPAVKAEKNNSSYQRSTSLFLPFLDDFHYADRQNFPSVQWWEDSAVFVNQGFPKYPPSIGVATFDGLNKHGYPYDTSPLPNLNNSKASDTLTSRGINLFVSSTSQTFTPNDSIGLSFYYQARGNGEAPEAIDSLILDFYRPLANDWDTRVWSSRGNNNPNQVDTFFKRAFLMLRDTAYFHDGFKFRFRNKATNSGNFDHWHLDYVYLNANRDAKADTLYNDVTFGGVPTTFLNDYYAMPWEQYQTSNMSRNNSVKLRNSYSQPINIYYENKFYNPAGNNVYAYSAQANNIPPFRTSGYYNNPAFNNPAAHPTFTYSYPYPMTDSADYLIKHYVYRSGANNDFITLNDTAYQYQRFRNYYALDDGGAEAGYYVLGVAGQMAVKTVVNVTDTLRAVRIYFDPAPLGSASRYYFKIRVYAGNTLPTSVVYVSDTMFPKYRNADFKLLPEYKLPVPIILNPGTYFIGIQQQLSTGLVVGFDRNSKNNGNLVYNSGTNWEVSGIDGAVMIRPVFGRTIPPPTGINELKEIADKIKVYPNPATQFLFIENESGYQANFKLLNALGQPVLQGFCESSKTEINLSELPNGIYFLSIHSGERSLRQQKIVIAN